jgi:medium-chain acyl-CoA ligase, mitochondrial
MNPAYQIPEMEFSLSKIDAKAIIAPEKFMTQNYYEMLAKSIPSIKEMNGKTIEKNEKNSLRHVIIYSDKKLP